MNRTFHKVNRLLFTLSTALLMAIGARAQMDIALVATADPEVYEFHWTARAPYSAIMNSVFSIKWDASAGGTISEDDFENLCSNSRAPLSTNGQDVEVVGAFRYYTFRCDGSSALGTAAQCGFATDQTRALHRFRIVGISGCPNIGLTNDLYVQGLNRDFFVSVGGGPDLAGAFLSGQLGVPFTVTPGSYGPACSTGADIALGGTPAGGTWSGTGVTGNSFDPSVGTQTLTYTVTQGSCTVSQNTTITVTNVATPTISAGGPTTFCAGGSVVLTSSSATGNSWSPGGQTTQSITVSASGTYSVTVTSGGCSATSAGTTVTVNPNPATPTISAGGPTTFCAGGSVVLTSSSATGNSWSPGGQTTQSITVSASGTYSVTVTSGGCSATSAGTTVTVNPSPATPTISAGGPTTFCAGGSVVLTSSSATGNSWSPGGQTTQSITVSASGTYAVTVTNGQGCSATSAGTTVTVNPNPATPTITPNGPTTFCAGGSVVLTSSSPINNLWFPAAQISQSITVTSSGTYSVMVDNAQGCTAMSAGTVVTVNPSPATPTISAGGPTTFCAGGSVVLTSSSATGNSWSPGGQTTQSITVSASGTYSVTVTSGGCSATSAGTTVTVNPNPATPTITPNGPTTFCAGGSVVLTSSSPNNNLWFPAAQISQSITVTSSGTYSVMVDNAQGCTAMSAATTVTVNPNPATPTITADGPTTFCSGGSVTLTSSSATGNVWSPGGQTSQSITVSASGSYSVTVTNGQGCSATSNAMVVTVNTNCDCLGVPGGPALPGTSCNDGNANTVNDTWSAGCVCAGVLPNDCEGTPGGPAQPGTPCDDGIPTTGNDTWSSNCQCIGELFDCEGVPGGSELPGTSCDDGLATTGNDIWNESCQCVGQLIDCEGVPGGSDLPGTPCDDGLATTGNDTWNGSCQCVGQLIDCEGVPGGSDLPGTPCDDGLATTGNDTWNGSCQCIGQVIDCEGVPGGSDLPGTPCDDGLATTGNDTWNVSCQCIGQVIDCEGVAGGTDLPGTPCDDGNPLSTDDTWSTGCQCVGVLPNDCEGTPGGPAQPGTPCDDGLATTGNDTWSANCQCIGQVIDCEGVAGGTDLPGTPCDDGLATTGNDTWNGSCQCVGQVIDCEGVAGGTDLPGTPCDDGDPDTSNDTWNANCVCVGELAEDCEGVPGGTAQPGTPCDDGLTTTGNDTWTVNCQCVGQLIDCEGIAGGTDLPGTPCDDGLATTGNDTWNGSCQCVGQVIDCEGVAGGTDLPGTPCDDGLATTGNDTWNVSCECVGQVIDCEGIAGGTDLPGTPCDDGNPGTIDDTWSANCTCIGEPVGGCDHPVVLVMTTDGNADETSWEVLLEGSNTVVCSGGPFPGVDNSTFGQNCCLTTGCYTLRVLDSAGDGMTTGGYVLKEGGANGRRIIDNANDGVFGSTSQIAGGQGFCMPLGNDRLIFSNCDRLFWTNNQYAVATENVAVSATWVPGGSNAVQPSNSGYEFWIYDPDGTYSFRRFRSHNVSDGFSPASALRACHMKINSWLNTVTTPHIPANVLMNVRVRGRVAGQNFPFGPACRFKIDANLAQCPPTALVNDPQSPNFSCGAIKPFGVNTSRVYAWSRTGANRYQFEFTLPGEGNFVKVVTSNTQICILNWTVDPLVNGVTYNVRVRVSRDGGTTWCPWGETCLLTINNGTAEMVVTQVSGTAQVVTPVLTAWPNPNRGEQLFLNITGMDRTLERIGVELYDLTGKQVVMSQLPVAEGMLNTSIALDGGMPSGIYLMRVTMGDRTQTERIVIQR